MREASRTQSPGVRFSGLFEMCFRYRKWHEARMEQKENCKISYGSKTYTAEHSVRVGSRTQHAKKILFFDTPDHLHSADSLKKGL